MTEQDAIYSYGEDDPRSQASAAAMAEFSGKPYYSPSQTELSDRWGLDPNMDPRVVATKAAIIAERSYDAYRQREAWVMQPKEEYQV